MLWWLVVRGVDGGNLLVRVKREFELEVGLCAGGAVRSGNCDKHDY